MKRITVYADFDFLTNPEEIGILGYEHVRGQDHFGEVRAAIKDWRKNATELQIPIKLLESYSIRWDEL